MAGDDDEMFDKKSQRYTKDNRTELIRQCIAYRIVLHN